MRRIDLQLEGATQGAMEVARTRLVLPIFLFLLGFSCLTLRLISIGLFEDLEAGRYRALSVKKEIVMERADIVDRNGIILATNLTSPALGVRPKLIADPVEAAANITAILPELSRTSVLNKLRSSRHFLYLKRNLTPTQVWQINALGYPGLVLEKAEKRIYPQGSLVSHVLGFVNVDNEPQAGVEKFFNDHLSNPLRSHEPLVLSLDGRVQHILRAELKAAVDRFSAKGASGIVMDVNSGEILAMTSLPDFEPNQPIDPTLDHMSNRNIQAVYELGSGFKAFTVAMALDSGVTSLQGQYDATEPLRVAGFSIRDDHAKERWLSVPEVFTYSSNIGSALMARDIGPERQKAYLERLGMFEKTAIELSGAVRPLLPRQWGEVESMTVSYGHGIAVTPLHLVSGIASIVNGGRLIPATLLRQDEAVNMVEKKRDFQRVISADTSRKMRQLMRLAVEYGTGGNARVEGYLVGGKTGTAEKASGGGYDKKALLSSFVGVFPMDNPRYVIFAMLDEPQGIKETLGFASAGWTAAPVVGNVIERIGPLLGVKPSRGSEMARDNLILLSAEKR